MSLLNVYVKPTEKRIKSLFFILRKLHCQMKTQLLFCSNNIFNWKLIFFRKKKHFLWKGQFDNCSPSSRKIICYIAIFTWDTRSGVVLHCIESDIDAGNVIVVTINYRLLGIFGFLSDENGNLFLDGLSVFIRDYNHAWVEGGQLINLILLNLQSREKIQSFGRNILWSSNWLNSAQQIAASLGWRGSFTMPAQILFSQEGLTIWRFNFPCLCDAICLYRALWANQERKTRDIDHISLPCSVETWQQENSD